MMKSLSQDFIQKKTFVYDPLPFYCARNWWKI